MLATQTEDKVQNVRRVSWVPGTCINPSLIGRDRIKVPEEWSGTINDTNLGPPHTHAHAYTHASMNRHIHNIHTEKPRKFVI